jgi:hypothetical protein
VSVLVVVLGLVLRLVLVVGLRMGFFITFCFSFVRGLNVMFRMIEFSRCHVPFDLDDRGLDIFCI